MHGPAHIGFAPSWMLDQRATLDPQRACAAVGLALASLLWLEAMGLAMVPIQGRDADDPPIVWSRLPSHCAVGQHPGIDTMRLPRLCQLLARFLQSQPLAQFPGLVALFGLHRSQLTELPIEPVLARFERGKGLIPALFATGRGFDIFHHKHTDREELAEPGCQAQFPRPSGPGGGRQLLLAPLAVLAWLAARGLAFAAGAAHA